MSSLLQLAVDWSVGCSREAKVHGLCIAPVTRASSQRSCLQASPHLTVMLVWTHPPPLSTAQPTTRMEGEQRRLVYRMRHPPRTACAMRR